MFLIVINGEKAAFNTPTFAQKRERTLDMLIKDLFSEHMNDGRGVSRHALSWLFEPNAMPRVNFEGYVSGT
jgi:hypothetical protein